MSADDRPSLVELGDATLAYDADAPSRARALLVQWLDGGMDPDSRADACLLVSELVANSVLHAAQPAGARLRVTAAAFDGLVRIEVDDLGHGPVRRRRPDPLEGGFGLHLVELIATRWGTDHRHGTKVWFELGTRPATTTPSARRLR